MSDWRLIIDLPVINKIYMYASYIELLRCLEKSFWRPSLCCVLSTKAITNAINLTCSNAKLSSRSDAWWCTRFSLIKQNYQPRGPSEKQLPRLPCPKLASQPEVASQRQPARGSQPEAGWSFDIREFDIRDLPLTFSCVRNSLTHDKTGLQTWFNNSVLQNWYDPHDRDSDVSDTMSCIQHE